METSDGCGLVVGAVVGDFYGEEGRFCSTHAKQARHVTFPEKFNGWRRIIVIRHICTQDQVTEISQAKPKPRLHPFFASSSAGSFARRLSDSPRYLTLPAAGLAIFRL